MSQFTETQIGILKGCALLQFNGEKFFLFFDENGEIETAYEGTQEEAQKDYAIYAEATESGNDSFGDDNYIMTFAEWCEENLSEVTPIDGDEESGNYIVLTDEEADEKAKDSIKDSLWAFNANFIIEHSKLPWEAEEMIKSYQEDKCEGANDTIEALIENMDEFIKDAIGADGRGHFLNTYDGNENEETVEGETFYIYRMN